MNKITRALMITLLILMLVLGSIYQAFYIAPQRFTTRHETLSSSLIGSQMNDVNILFFSDLDYGTFMNETRMKKLVECINNAGADIVIFGGDLYDQNVQASDEANAVITSELSEIKAPLGKFAVYGDNDEASDDMKNTVSSIYQSSAFEVLENRSVALHNRGSQSVSLVGIDNSLNGTPDITAAYNGVSRDSYVITVCHTPDTADDVPADLTQYFLAGHSHGGQVYYFFSAMVTPAGAVNHLRGKSQIGGNFTLDITNGVGTTERDVRFLANAEVVLYTLHHQDASDQ